MRKMIMGVLAVAVMAGGVAGQTYWKRAYGSQGNAITPTPDGNFIVAGAIVSDSGWEDLFLVKVKPNGDSI
jgi:hypothetical protein